MTENSPDSRTLFLLRHAKAVPDDAYPDDHERPLNERGREAAALMGQHIAGREVRPSCILTSTAERTRQTTEQVVEALGGEVEQQAVDALYLASPGSLLQQVNRLSDAHSAVMLVGHNPGMHLLTMELAGKGDTAAVERLQLNFPTAALAILRFESGHWKDIVPGSGYLLDFVTPRSLAE